MHSPSASPDHKEAVRLLWKSRHVPVLTILAVSWAAARALSAIVSLITQGPANPIP
jgi:hypothetical protein